ncbi:MAG: prenyltransferase [Thermaerobacter sp.]|nr:prenyltransferase [Thermaerobacter sp.]
MNRAATFLALTRPKFLPLSVIPMLITARYAGLPGEGSLPLLFWCMVGVAMMHAGANVVNDCYDYCLGADKKDTAGRYSGGSGVLPKGLVAVGEAKVLFAVLFVAAIGIAAGLSRNSAWPIVFALGGTAAGIAYTMPPFKLSYRGYGELLVALSFGPGLMLSTYYVLTGGYSPAVFLVSVVIGALIGMVLLLNEFTDAASDRLAGKRNLAVRIQDILHKLPAAE